MVNQSCPARSNRVFLATSGRPCIATKHTVTDVNPHAHRLSQNTKYYQQNPNSFNELSYIFATKQPCRTCAHPSGCVGRKLNHCNSFRKAWTTSPDPLTNAAFASSAETSNSSCTSSISAAEIFNMDSVLGSVLCAQAISRIQQGGTMECKQQR